MREDQDDIIQGHIDASSLAGGIDLHQTLTSGQTFRWRRSDGNFFSTPTIPTPWYETVEGEVPLRVRQTHEGLAYRAPRCAESIVRRLFRLDDNLAARLQTGPEDEFYHEAIDRFRGMRLIQDSLYISLMSFICSTNMRVERIHAMVQALMTQFGQQFEFDGRILYSFPSASELASASEEALRDCGLGYRSEYVAETARAIVTDSPPLPDVNSMSYEPLRERLLAYHGVGPKVADCAILFGAGDVRAVPLDRWIMRTIEQHYPHCAKDNYEETADAIRIYLGENPGYAQTYLFHHIRTR